MENEERILFQYDRRIKEEKYALIFLNLILISIFIAVIIVIGIQNIIPPVIFLFIMCILFDILVWYHLKLISKVKVTNNGFFLQRSIYIPIEDIKVISKPKRSHSIWIEKIDGKRYYFELNRYEWEKITTVFQDLSILDKIETNK